MSAALGLPARLQLETTAETAFGGRESAWSDLAALWVELTPGPERELAAGEAPSLRIEAATAIARDDARARRGQRLIVGAEPPWTVLAVLRAQPQPGRMTLRLERTS